MSVNARENPFTLTYTGIAKLLLSNQHLTRLVETGNLIRFDKGRVNDPLKPLVDAADLPELILISDGMEMNLHSTSSTSEVVKMYSLLVATGSKRINELLNQVQWEVTVALSNWKNVLSPLQWRDKAFIKLVNVRSVTEGLSDPERNRGIEGWSSIWRVEVKMIFTTSDLLSLLS